MATHAHAVADVLAAPDDRFFNRELSWLDFNERVLVVAEDQSLPLLERQRLQQK